MTEDPKPSRTWVQDLDDRFIARLVGYPISIILGAEEEKCGLRAFWFIYVYEQRVADFTGDRRLNLAMREAERLADDFDSLGTELNERLGVAKWVNVDDLITVPPADLDGFIGTHSQ